MNAFDNYLSEVSIFIGTKHHDLVQLDGSLQDGATKDQTDTLRLVSGINDELGVDLGVTWLSVGAFFLLELLAVLGF